MNILVMGATGYIGGRLAPRLSSAGHEVRCLSRSPERLADIPWATDVEIVQGDALKPDTLAAAMDGIDVVYYLVHSIGTGSDFEDTDRTAASNTARAASEAGVSRIVYLGGFVPSEEEDVSAHLASRAEVGQIFLDHPVPAVVLQAAVIIGSGSASFEMLRYLTERLPAMVTPRWVKSLVQPIAVRDVLTYLERTLELPADANRRFDIAGPDVISYRQMMQRYASVAGLNRRIIVPVPILSPWLSSHWINVVTPVPKAIAQPLIGSLRNNAVASEHDIDEFIPFTRMGFDQSVELALERVGRAEVETRWSESDRPQSSAESMPTDPEWAGGTVYQDDRCVEVDAPASSMWRVIEGIGGDRGWYSTSLAWSVRGRLDRLMGGVGIRRGRRDPDQLSAGEAVDSWRVEAMERGHLLRLRSEMKLPGQAWLEFSIREIDVDRCELHQRAVFIPRGLLGQAYWWGIHPLHNSVYGSMISDLAGEATAGATSDDAG